MKILAILFLCLMFCVGVAYSQNTGMTITTTNGAIVARAVLGTTVANCPAVVASVTQTCLVATDEYISRNGAAWASTSTAPSTIGVTSFNGMTGNISYTPPVISVNGKSGNVILGVVANLN